MSALIPRKAAQRNKLRDRRQRDLRPGPRGPTGGTTRGLPPPPPPESHLHMQSAGAGGAGGQEGAEWAGVLGAGRNELLGVPPCAGRWLGWGGASAGHLAVVTPPPRLHRVGEGGNDPNFRRQDGKDILLFLQGFSARACIFPDVRLGFPRGRASHSPRPAPIPHTCSLSDGECSAVPALSPWPLPSREGTLEPPGCPPEQPPRGCLSRRSGVAPGASCPH